VYDSNAETPISYTDSDGYTIQYDYNSTYNRITSIDVKDPEEESIYTVQYSYDLAGRLRQVDANDIENPQMRILAGLEYDANGNRQELNYYLDRSEGGNFYPIQYISNADNFLTSIVASVPNSSVIDYAFNAANAGDIDGLGRLRHAQETMYIPGQSEVSHRYDYAYNMRSELLAWQAYNWNGGWAPAHLHEFNYSLDGNINTKTIDQQNTSYGYNGDRMTSVGASGLDWDGNGQLTTGLTANFTWNWDGKLRTAASGSDSIHVKYDPMGNRVWKQTSDGQNTTTRKYIVDISGNLPTILCEIDTADSSVKKSYFYADGQILAQKDHADPANVNKTYFYVHDRLGSVRQVLDYHALTTALEIAHSYGYTPFGQFDAGRCYDDAGEADNPFRFTGQWYDAEIGQYYLRARMYDPQLMRFISRDPAFGKVTEPITLHKYLYCWNNPANLVDFTGELPGSLGDVLATMSIRAFVGLNTGFVIGVFREIITQLAMGGLDNLDPFKILASGVSGAILGALAGGTAGYFNPGYEAFISSGGTKILVDMAFTLVAGPIADIGGRSIEKMFKRNAGHVLATNALIESVYYGW